MKKLESSLKKGVEQPTQSQYTGDTQESDAVDEMKYLIDGFAPLRNEENKLTAIFDAGNYIVIYGKDSAQINEFIDKVGLAEFDEKNKHRAFMPAELVAKELGIKLDSVGFNKMNVFTAHKKLLGFVED